MEQQREDEGEDARGSGAESAVDAGGIALAALGKPVVGLRGAYREGGDATAGQAAASPEPPKDINKVSRRLKHSPNCPIPV